MSDLSEALTVAYLSWATWAFAHSCSFPLSDLSDSLTVAHLSWAIWATRSQSLIWFERNELNERNERMSEWAMSKWANERMSDERIPSPDLRKMGVVQSGWWLFYDFFIPVFWGFYSMLWPFITPLQFMYVYRYVIFWKSFNILCFRLTFGEYLFSIDINNFTKIYVFGYTIFVTLLVI